MLRKLLFTLIITLLFLACNKQDKKVYMLGYFYDKNSSEIYLLSEDELVNYNFLDSTSYSQNFSIDSNQKMTINNVKYQYKNYDDSLTVFDYIQGDLKLKRIGHSFLRINDLANTEWEAIKATSLSDSIKGFFKFEKDGKIFEFIKEKNNKLAIEFPRQHFFVGKFFDKFDVYSSFMSYILLPIDKENISILTINEKNVFEEVLFKKSSSKNLDPKYIGSWSKVKDTLKKNMYVYFHLLNELNQPGSKYDSIKKQYSFNEIQFKKDSVYIRSTLEEKLLLERKSYLTYNPDMDLIFLENKNTSEPSYLEVSFKSNDTINVIFDNPRLTFTYARKN